jgi:hypothetical protein
VCIRSSLNTNKAPLTYCQLSEVNLSRINFRRKRFRLSGPENPLVSNYLRIDRPAPRRWRDECCLYLYFTASRAHSLSHARARAAAHSLSLLQIAHALSLHLVPPRSRVSLLARSPLFSVSATAYLYVHTYERTPSR